MEGIRADVVGFHFVRTASAFVNLRERFGSMTKTITRIDTQESPLVRRRFAAPAIGAGLFGGALLAMMMMIVMGAMGMGFWSPLNLGIPAFSYTITPSLSMLPSLVSAMGINLPSSAMAQLATAIKGGHISTAMANQLGGMLMSMHVPVAKVHMMGLLMTGHATNSTVASLMNSMSPAARNTIMSAMPLSASRIVVGMMMHFAFSALLGVAFFAIIIKAQRMNAPALNTTGGILGASMIGGAIVYAINVWILLPATNPMMAFVPQPAFFLAHLLFGLGVGLVLARVLKSHNIASVTTGSRHG